jgi:sulfur carrier protein ThiS
MKILFINNDGGGFAGQIEVPAGTTVRQLFEQQVHSGKPDGYLIRVNRQPVAADQVLQEGDRASITPVKIEGASEATFLWFTHARTS